MDLEQPARVRVVRVLDALADGSRLEPVLVLLDAGAQCRCACCVHHCLSI